jgi:putative DNA methylase
LRRSLGDSNFAEFLSGDLVDSANEAVANVARFSEIDAKRKYELARSDYEKKMTRVFAEASRVLTMDGVLTVMFTHKKVEAWDSLGRSLIDGGFEIEASWPVHTESTHSQHIARKASAASTILLSCRKRLKGREPVWWDDLQAEVRHVAREKASEFLAAGIDGVDVYISTFGPALSVISRQWPVYTSEVDPETGDPRSLRPEEALDLARQEVADLRRQGLLLGRKVEFDPVTDWYLLAWDAFSAVEFPYDEARKLALALGLDLDGELVASRVVSKKGSSVVLQEPRQRRRPGLADPEELTFSRLIDAAHALMVVYREDGVRGAESFLRRTRLGGDEGFVALLQALVNAIPRTKQKGKFVRPEAAALDGVSVLFPDLVIPEEAEIVLEPSQGSLDFDSVEDADEDESDEDDGDGEDE